MRAGGHGGIERLELSPAGAGVMPVPWVSTLESIVPWKYHSWNGKTVNGIKDEEVPKVPDSMKPQIWSSPAIVVGPSHVGATESSAASV